MKDVEGFEQLTKDKNESRTEDDLSLTPTTNDSEELHENKEEDMEELKPGKDVVFLNLTKDFKELTSKLNVVDSKLKEVRFSH